MVSASTSAADSLLNANNALIARDTAYGSSSFSAASSATASISASSAVTNAGIATTQAGIATGAASSASTSSTSASNSATSASNSATEASNSATEAKDAVDSINYDRITTLEDKTINISVEDGNTKFINNLEMGSLLNGVLFGTTLTLNANGNISQDTSSSNTLGSISTTSVSTNGNITQTGLSSTTSLENTTVAKLTSTGDITQTFGDTILKNLTSDNLTTGSIKQHTIATNNILQKTAIDTIYSSFLYPSSESISFNTNPIGLSNIINIGRPDGTTQIVLNGNVSYTNSNFNIGLSEFMNQVGW